MNIVQITDQFLGKKKRCSERQKTVALVLFFQLWLVLIILNLATHFLPFWLYMVAVGSSGSLAFGGLFLMNSYATLGILFCYVGFMSPVVLECSIAGWVLGVPAFCLGMLCVVRHLQWRDKNAKNAVEFIGGSDADNP
jgi:hypothetical protein